MRRGSVTESQLVAALQTVREGVRSAEAFPNDPDTAVLYLRQALEHALKILRKPRP